MTTREIVIAESLDAGTAQALGACDREEIETAEYECSLIVYRSRVAGSVQWICDRNGGGNTLYDPGDWASAIHDYAESRGWDSADEPAIPTAYERAGVHAATGIQYEPTQAERIEAAAEQYQCDLYREIQGLD